MAKMPPRSHQLCATTPTGLSEMQGGQTPLPCVEEINLDKDVARIDTELH